MEIDRSRPTDQEILDYEKTIKSDVNAPFVSEIISLKTLEPEYEFAVETLKMKTKVDANSLF